MGKRGFGATGGPYGAQPSTQYGQPGMQYGQRPGVQQGPPGMLMPTWFLQPPVEPQWVVNYRIKSQGVKQFAGALTAFLFLAIILGVVFFVVLADEDIGVFLGMINGEDAGMCYVLLLFVALSLVFLVLVILRTPKAEENRAYENWVKQVDLEEAQRLITAGRFEDAATIYEKHKMFAEAGQARAGNRTHFVKQVSVDMNVLIQQMRQGGITTTYKCPSCGAGIPISGTSTIEGLQKCQYCGTTLQVTDIAKLVQGAMGGPPMASTPAPPGMVQAPIAPAQAPAPAAPPATAGGAPCPNCRKPVAADYAMCPYCGQPLRSPPALCRQCGRELKSDFAMCPYCGAPK